MAAAMARRLYAAGTLGGPRIPSCRRLHWSDPLSEVSERIRRMQTFTIVPNGTFSLKESVEFGFGQRHAEEFDGIMRLAFCLDRSDRQVGVEVTQDAAGVHGTVRGDPVDEATVRAQVARVLSLDQDIAGFEDVGGRDPVIGQLQRVAPGLLPPLFYSPYEAAVWSVLSARRPAVQMAEVRRRLSEQHGATFQLAGKSVAALPTPAQLSTVKQFPGITPDKLERIHAVAKAALKGALDVSYLRSIGPDAAIGELQRLKGIGPFYSSLITVRAVGFTDALPTEEPMVREAVGRLYGPSGPCSIEQLVEIAEKWRPYRTWCCVLIRAASSRLR